MKLTLDAPAELNLVRSYSTSELRIADRTLFASCIVAPHVLIADWPPQSSAELERQHLDAVFALEPEIVLLGSGARQQFPSREVRQAFAARAVALEPMDLGAACRTYNVLAQEARRAVAMLFLK